MQAKSPAQPANDNTVTLQSYQAKTQTYIEATPHKISDDLKQWLNTALEYVPKNGTILEIGSGFGRDAAYVQSLGYRVECSDAVANFVELLQTKGFATRTLNILTDDLDGAYDMVFADAVLLHFTPEETGRALDKIRAALKPDGIFAFTVKRGDGAAWTHYKLDAPRYFCYWQPGPLKALLAAHGFAWLKGTEGHTSHNNADWLQIIAQKSSQKESP